MLRRFRDGTDQKRLGFLEDGFQFYGFDLVRTLAGISDERDRLPDAEQKTVPLLIIARHRNHPSRVRLVLSMAHWNSTISLLNLKSQKSVN
jgi:hypothetical protein